VYTANRPKFFNKNQPARSRRPFDVSTLPELPAISKVENDKQHQKLLYRKYEWQSSTHSQLEALASNQI
jgi:hypothetical protein